MKTSFIQFILIYSVHTMLLFQQTSVQGAKNTDSITFFTAHWFYAILPNVPSDLPAFLPPQYTFSWYQ